MKIMLSIHVPKTGGTSFLRLLEQIYGNRLCMDYDWLERPNWVANGISSLTDDDLRAAVAKVACIHGHYNGRKYLKLRGVEGIQPTYITWLRNPIERALSAYYYLRGLNTPPDKQLPWEVKAKTLDIHEFFKTTPYGRNRQTAQLGSLTEADFGFIGLTEFYEESINLFLSRFFPDLERPAEIPFENANKNRVGERYEIGDDLRSLLEAANTDDLALYETARRRLAADLATDRQALSALPVPSTGNSPGTTPRTARCPP